MLPEAVNFKLYSRQPWFYYLKSAGIYNLRKQFFFEKLPFLDPLLFWLSSRIFDDTFFSGMDEPP